MRRWMRASAVALIVLASLSATGCGMACHQAGYVNTLDIRVTESPERQVASVEVCFDGECVTGDPVEPDAAALHSSQWIFELFVAAPTSVRVRMLDSSAAELASEDVDIVWVPTWTPNGPGCENRSTTDPLFIELP